MTETKNPGEKRLSVNPTKTLTLKRGVAARRFTFSTTTALLRPWLKL